MLPINKILCSDSLEFMKARKEFEFDIIYADPPYNLGSEIIVRPDGRMDYSKKADFMGKWDAPDGEYWEAWFEEAYRSLKFGGYCILFSIDRQCAMPKYYAIKAGFEKRQSLYYYYISNFPKSSDLSKMIDRNAGAVIKKGVGFRTAGHDGRPIMGDPTPIGEERDAMRHIAQTSLAKKYSGYKYSCAPLKQTNETVLIFQKPYLTGSCLHDTLALEARDERIACGALDIDGGRCGVESIGVHSYPGQGIYGIGGKASYTSKENGENTKPSYQQNMGRYPAQTFVDEEAAEILDKQSGISKSVGGRIGNKGSNLNMSGCKFKKGDPGFGDIGGVSKILHKCSFEDGEHDLYLYNPKVSGQERNEGLEEFEIQKGGSYEFRQDGSLDGKIPESNRNFHPTLKPISLNYRILSLFKTPNPQKICYPFAGTASEIIGGLKAGFTDWVGCEISEEYIKIGEARIAHWTKKFQDENAQTKMF